MVYGPDELEEQEDLPLDEAVRAARGRGVGWISLYQPTPQEFQVLEKELNLHPLALEDAGNERQRPKVEEFSDHTYIVARSLGRDEDRDVVTYQSNIFFSKDWVVVIHDQPRGLFDDVRHRIRRGRPRIRSSGPDYLVYALLDAIVDTYFPLLEEIGNEVEDLEDEMFEGTAEKAHLDRVHRLKTDLRRVRRTIWPARDAMALLHKEEAVGFKKQTMPFLRDVHDHIVQAIDMTENHREATSSLMDLYLNIVSHRLNGIMKVLTIVATLFIPLTFVAGVYGMNFDPELAGNMPELNMPYAYVGFWVVAVLIFLGEIWFFKRKGWI